jgi:hypothetical protein
METQTFETPAGLRFHRFVTITARKRAGRTLFSFVPSRLRGSSFADGEVD